jgi:hypothetical protein
MDSVYCMRRNFSLSSISLVLGARHFFAWLPTPPKKKGCVAFVDETSVLMSAQNGLFSDPRLGYTIPSVVRTKVPIGEDVEQWESDTF